MSSVKATEIDRRFDDGEDVLDYFDLGHPVVEDAPAVVTRKININLPTWMIERLDAKAGSIAVSRNALVNMWLDERLAEEAGSRRLTDVANGR